MGLKEVGYVLVMLDYLVLIWVALCVKEGAVPSIRFCLVQIF